MNDWYTSTVFLIHLPSPIFVRVALAKLNPYVITFGQPATILSPCERVSSARWYRWINTKDSESAVTLTALTYDPVPFVPGLGADFFGMSRFNIMVCSHLYLCSLKSFHNPSIPLSSLDRSYDSFIER